MQPPDTDIETEAARLRLERGKLTVRGASAHNTEKGYAYDFGMFERWALTMCLKTLPASDETVSLYLTHLISDGKKVSTATRRAAAIARIHRDRGLPSPVTAECRAVLRGARRIKGEAPRQMHPLSLAQLRAIAAALGEDATPMAIRNRAILVVGFASALRRCNIVALRLADVEFTAGGAVLHIRHEKNDQRGAGRMIGLPFGEHPDTCPVRCLQAWLKVRGSFSGPLFTHVYPRPSKQGLHTETIALVVQRALTRIGEDNSGYAGHSLRAGFITEAGEANCSEILIAATSGHKCMAVLRTYFRRRDLFKANATGMIGL